MQSPASSWQVIDVKARPESLLVSRILPRATMSLVFIQFALQCSGELHELARVILLRGLECDPLPGPYDVNFMNRKNEAFW